MNLLDIVRRVPKPEPWSEGEKIPWDEPGFSERMLREHLSQAHDAASRRAHLIDEHVTWIHQHVLAEQRTRVLDICCGPGLYTSRLASLGHECVGLDFSPASIRHAREMAGQEELDCTYHQGDVRSVGFGAGYGLAMLIFGELNTFRPEDARRILTRTRHALGVGGKLVVEAHPYGAVEAEGHGPATWQSVSQGLFSPQPHLRLEESFWDAARHVATRRYFIIDVETARVSRYAASMQAYTDEGYRELFVSCGFQLAAVHGSLSGGESDGDFVVLIGHAV